MLNETAFVYKGHDKDRVKGKQNCGKRALSLQVRDLLSGFEACRDGEGSSWRQLQGVWGNEEDG